MIGGDSTMNLKKFRHKHECGPRPFQIFSSVNRYRGENIGIKEKKILEVDSVTFVTMIIGNKFAALQELGHSRPHSFT